MPHRRPEPPSEHARRNALAGLIQIAEALAGAPAEGELAIECAGALERARALTARVDESNGGAVYSWPAGAFAADRDRALRLLGELRDELGPTAAGDDEMRLYVNEGDLHVGLVAVLAPRGQCHVALRRLASGF